MFSSRTLFVVAAGASAELNLPIGSELKTKIARALQFGSSGGHLFSDDVISTAMFAYVGTQPQNPNVNTLAQLRRDALLVSSNMVLAPSIDNFLNSHRHNSNVVALGKVAIARCILNAEKLSYLYAFENGIYHLPLDRDSLTSAWHISLWHQLNSEITADNIDTIFSNVSFVVFNYDRCLEHFLYLCLRSYYDLSRERAAEIMKTANIIHPYGKVGGLPWEMDKAKVAFGSSSPDSLFELAKELRTFTESWEEGTVTEIKEMVRTAETIVMLGFGFLDQNIDLLTKHGDVKRVFMTAHATSQSDSAMAAERVGQMIGKEPIDYTIYRADHQYEVHVVHGECRTLFADHRLRLPSAVQ